MILARNIVVSDAIWRQYSAHAQIIVVVRRMSLMDDVLVETRTFVDPRIPPIVPVTAPTAPPTNAPTGPASLLPTAAPSRAP